MNKNLVIMFNHSISGVRSKVESFYRPYVNDLFIIQPFSSSKSVREDTNYYSGSYLWQSGLIEFFKNHKKSNKIDNLVLIHDDLAIRRNSKFINDINNNNNSFNNLYHLNGEMGSWGWHFKIAQNYFTPKVQLFGSGVDSVIKCLKESKLYIKNQDYIESLPKSKLYISKEKKQHLIVQNWLNNYFPDNTYLDFNLPLYIGNSDFLSLPHDFWTSDLALDFLERTVACGIFVEAAIPTMLMWSNIKIDLLHKELLFPFGDDYEMFSFIKTYSEIDEFFEKNPGINGIHPVKFSSILPY